MPVTIRAARPEEAKTVADFALKLFEQHRQYDTERFAALGNLEGAIIFYASRIEAVDAAVLVAEFDYGIVGFAYVQYEAVNFADLLESAAWLHDIYIDKAARNAGVGKQLVEAAAEAGKKLGATKLMLHVAERNSPGREFFERVGFRTTMLEMMIAI